jgi:hypothetical protein
LERLPSYHFCPVGFFLQQQGHKWVGIISGFFDDPGKTFATFFRAFDAGKFAFFKRLKKPISADTLQEVECLV